MEYTVDTGDLRSKEFPVKLESILVLFKELKDDPDFYIYCNIFTLYVENVVDEASRASLVNRIAIYLGNRGDGMGGVFEGKSRVMQILEKQTLQRVLEECREEGIEIGVDKGANAASLILNTDMSDEEIAQETMLSVEKIRPL